MTRDGARATGLYSLLFLAVLLSGLNMRPFITSMGPVLDDMRASLGLSASVAGLLVALPTLFFGILGIIMPRFLRGFSPQGVVVVALAVLAAGVALRSVLGVTGLFAGIFVSSVGISAMMVVMPVITKSAFSHRLGLAMSFYTMSFCLGASLGAGLAVPLAQLPYSSWHWSLAFWVLPALGAALVWSRVPRGALPVSPSPGAPSIPWRPLYRDRLAWQVTLLMGLQSCLGQSTITWMPAMLADRGMAAAPAGAALSIALLIQLVTAFAAPWLSMRGRDQRPMISLMLALMLGGMAGGLYAPATQIWTWILVMGLGMGGTFSLALSLIVLRTRSAHEATALSGMAQGIGYMIASVGPVLAGALYEYRGDWHAVAALFLGIGLIAWWAGMGAGKNEFILPQAPMPTRAQTRS
jgi:CP family cyanate transporter-like MFS transporter